MTSVSTELEAFVAENFYGDLESSSWSFYPNNGKLDARDLVDALNQYLYEVMDNDRISDYMVKNKRFFSLGAFTIGCVIVSWSENDNSVHMQIFDYVIK